MTPIKLNFGPVMSTDPEILALRKNDVVLVTAQVVDTASRAGVVLKVTSLATENEAKASAGAPPATADPAARQQLRERLLGHALAGAMGNATLSPPAAAEWAIAHVDALMAALDAQP